MFSSLKWSLRPTCPKCSKGRLFAGLLALQERCSHCGYEIDHNADTGDGPAFFVITFWGLFMAMGMGAHMIIFSPSYWAIALMWAPIFVAGTLYFLRLAKALLILYRYRLITKKQ